MTEEVDKNMESMLEELEEMQKVELYTAEETRVVNIKRKNFEQKIDAKPKADVTNFIDYINYEQLLLDNIRLRRNKRNIHDKKANIEHKIIKRIKHLYEVAFQEFPDEMILFLSFLKFCKRMNYLNAAYEVVKNMVKMHPDNPQIWQVAANWHANDRKDVVMAKNLLLKGLTIHKDNTTLYLQMIQFEMFEATKRNIQAEERATRQKICIDKLEKTLGSIFQYVTDCAFHIELLQMFEKHPFTKKLQDLICQHLLKCNLDNENVWHILAQRERSDFNIENEGSESDGTPMRTPKARLEACFAKYKQGLSRLSPTVKPKLWELYIGFLFQLNGEATGGGTVLKLRTLKEALSEALQEGNLDEKHYIAWLRLKDQTETLLIVESGVKAHPESSDLWLARLQYEIEHNGTPATVQNIFEQGAEALKKKGLPLWLAMLRYSYLISNDNVIEKFYKGSVEQSAEISHAIVPLYLEWLVPKRGIGAARKLYKSVCMKKPYCKDFHLVMLRIESNQIDANYQEWGEVHRLACEQFGDEDVDVWINCIEFYLHYNKKNEKTMECVKKLRKQAAEKLPKELVCLFEARFDIIRAFAQLM